MKKNNDKIIRMLKKKYNHITITELATEVMIDPNVLDLLDVLYSHQVVMVLRQMLMKNFKEHRSG